MVSPRTWGWQRWIAADRQDDWIDRLQQAGCETWTVTERPNRTRRLLAVYSADRAEVANLCRQFGGRLRAVKTSDWLPSRPAPPIRVAGKLEILSAGKRGMKRPLAAQLIIPHGIAFGSGEHATTSMLLRALVVEGGDLAPARVLDLGTGSGVLALAARRLGARKIVATDFDPDAVRTASENEALNFAQPLVRWQRSDVLKMRRVVRGYNLVLANLFSGLLIDAAPAIVACVAPGGRLWQSGILRPQQDEVIAVYQQHGLQLIRSARRGKWVMLQWMRPVKRGTGRQSPAFS